MNARERMYQRIERHGRDLIAVFHLPADTDPVNLCKRLRKIETALNRIMVNYCNGDASEIDADNAGDAALIAVAKMGIDITGVFVNRDPRGYSLKLTEEATNEARDAGIHIHRDMGGYGILAPEFDGRA